MSSAEGTASPPTFADLIAPIPAETFFAEYYGRKVLHIRGDAGKFAGVMSWRKLDALLNMTAVWTSRSLELALDGALVPARDYCRAGLDHGSGAPAPQPDPAAVTGLLRRGASLLLNDIDTLSPELAAVANALEATLEGRVQANLYCSARQHPAFPSHYDTHDVFAMHVEGEKLWRIYEGRLDNPVSHPTYKTKPQSFHDQAKGKVAFDVLLKPGDLLYIPRGTYHDALAQSDGTLHVAFGVTSLIGLDFVSSLFERALHDSLFRASFPRRHAPNGDASFARHLRALTERIASLAMDGATLTHMAALQDSYRYARGGFDLAGVMAAPTRYRVTQADFRVVRIGGDTVLQHGSKGTVIPSGLGEAVRWIVAQASFSVAELAAAAPQLGVEQRDELIRSLVTMGVLAGAA